MIPVIKTISEKKLIGMHISMSLAENKTSGLWRSFMPRRKEIKSNLTSELFSMRVYDASYDFKNFNFHAAFEKWAAIEVKDLDEIPDGMKAFLLPAGSYAVFHYKGLNTNTRIFEYIFGTWLPTSEYILDNRPHFEILGDKYKNNDPDSEEEIWVPVKLK
jgi:AraC family transcriptional regulator